MSTPSDYYVPDNSSVPTDWLYTQLLSQRDLSLQVPINYVSHPSVSLSAACFSTGRYEDSSLKTCFSNLLALNYRRFVVDIYWDSSPGRGVWSLCPGELGTVNDTTSSTSATKTTITSSALSSSQLSSSPNVREAIMDRSPSSAQLSPPQPAQQRQQRTGSSLNLANTQLSGSTALPSTTPLASVANDTTLATGNVAQTAPTVIAGVSELLYQVGQYNCTTSVDLDLVGHILTDHFEATADNVKATLKYLILNLHVAESVSNSSLSSSDLPSTGSFVSNVINSSLSNYLYTPFSLQLQRADINDTWFAPPATYFPILAYLNHGSGLGASATSDDWPTEGFVELLKAKRLLVGYGSVDSQLEDYDTSVDATSIFPSGALTAEKQVTFAASGVLTSGCLYDSSSISLPNVNSSWALAATPSSSDIAVIGEAASNLTVCGYSALLNQSLGVNADVNVTLYKDYIQSTIWSWNSGQPSDQSADSVYRCATFNATSGGKWQVSGCYDKHYAACRIDQQPYEWLLSSQLASYDRVSSVCPANSSFSVPRTALENTYLFKAIQTASDFDPGNDPLVWLNFNDLDTAGCWVIGTNATCPYAAVKSPGSARKVSVPVAAAVIVFVLAALTIFVKCAANRQSSKRRGKRGDGGWDYEGVPS